MIFLLVNDFYLFFCCSECNHKRGIIHTIKRDSLAKKIGNFTAIPTVGAIDKSFSLGNRKENGRIESRKGSGVHWMEEA